MCRIWNLADGKCRAVLEGHAGRLNQVALSEDGVTAVTASDDGTARVWSVPGGDCRHVSFHIPSASDCDGAASDLPTQAHYCQLNLVVQSGASCMHLCYQLDLSCQPAHRVHLSAGWLQCCRCWLATAAS